VVHFHLHLFQYLFLFFAGIFAGTIDTIAGGGGLIILPSLLSLNMPPATAMGTNRLQSCIGEIVAAFRFYKQGHIQIKELWLGFLLTGLGAALGAVTIMALHPERLMKILPFLLLVIFLFFIFSPSLKDNQVRQRLKPLTFYLCVGFFIGFYNGFFGPGTGSMWILALMYFMGLPMNKAVMQAKPFNTVGNIASLICFGIQGHIAYWTLLVMAPGQIIGAGFASQLVMKHGTRLVRPMFILVFTILMAKLFYSAF
jgi:uncharacterized membrane protein YfcA